MGHVAKYVKLNKVNTGGQMKKICILIVAKPSRPKASHPQRDCEISSFVKSDSFLSRAIDLVLAIDLSQNVRITFILK